MMALCHNRSMTKSNELPNFHSAKSAAAYVGCDPGTIRRQCRPAAVVCTSTGREFAVYAPDEVEALAAWTAEHGRGCRHRSRRGR
jgi:hypothetical protein